MRTYKQKALLYKSQEQRGIQKRRKEREKIGQMIKLIKFGKKRVEKKKQQC